MTTKTKTLLTPTDYVVTAGKTLDVYESLEKASQAQEIMSYKNPGKPIYILQLVSVGLLTKNQVKEIDKIAGKKLIANGH